MARKKPKNSKVKLRPKETGDVAGRTPGATEEVRSAPVAAREGPQAAAPAVRGPSAETQDRELAQQQQLRPEFAKTATPSPDKLIRTQENLRKRPSAKDLPETGSAAVSQQAASDLKNQQQALVVNQQREDAEKRRAEQEGQAKAQQARVHVFDPDFLVILFIAIVVDILDWVLGLGIIVGFVAGLPMVFWMIWKEGKVENAKEKWVRQTRVVSRRAGRAARGPRRGLRGRLTKRVSKRVALYIAEAIPGINLVPLWVTAVLLMLRKK